VLYCEDPGTNQPGLRRWPGSAAPGVILFPGGRTGAVCSRAGPLGIGDVLGRGNAPAAIHPRWPRGRRDAGVMPTAETGPS